MLCYPFFQFIYDNILPMTHFTKRTGYGFIHLMLADYMSWMSMQLSLNYHQNFQIFISTTFITRKSVDGEPSHIPALIKANRIEASYFLAYVAKYG